MSLVAVGHSNANQEGVGWWHGETTRVDAAYVDADLVPTRFARYSRVARSTLVTDRPEERDDVRRVTCAGKRVLEAQRR